MFDTGITTIVSEEMTFKWVVKNYSKSSIPHGSALRSPSFTVSSDGYNSTWHLLLYPHGENAEHAEFVSIRIVLEKCIHLPLNVTVNFTSFGDRYLKDSGKAVHQFKKINESFGCSQFLHQQFKQGFGNVFVGYHVKCGDTFTVNCILSVAYDIQNSLKSLTESMPKKFDLNNLSLDLQTLWENKNLSDFTIFVGKESFPVHKTILAARSPVFAALITHDMEEKRKNSMVIEEVDSDVVKEMLRYIYTGKAENLDTIAFELLKLADRYQLEELKKVCGGTLSYKLNVDNAVDLLISAELHQIEILKKHILHFILSHIKEFLEKDKLKPLYESPIYHALYDEIMHAMAAKINFSQ